MKYPRGREKILEFYRGEFESCYILFHPFLKIKQEEGNDMERTSSSKENVLPNELSTIFSKIKFPANAMLYVSNPNYPEEKKIIESGIEISWSQVIEQSNLNSYSEIQKALKTSIGAYRRIFQRKDLLKHLQEFLKKEKYWSPKEDIINPLTKKKLFQIFRLLELNKIINHNCNTENIPIDISEMSELEFCKTMTASYIYSKDKKVMVSQNRDTFFCLLLTKKKETMQKILANIDLEGILCDEESSMPWEFEKKEFNELVQKGKEKKIKNNSPSWWSRIFK